jgi:hypothetical protein
MIYTKENIVLDLLARNKELETLLAAEEARTQELRADNNEKEEYIGKLSSRLNDVVTQLTEKLLEV